ncbi:ROCK1 [Mytilus edulis]|uniref:ROCK1 n=1 Tax=Mytilus edulis TaxID=6550 RepID=A0A8S3TQP3_MYTED|nr:ROCK1 [Mytilus edulis]
MDQENQDDKWVLEKEQLENPRVRQLTIQGKEQYELKVYDYTKKLRRVSLTIDEQIHSFVNQEDNKVTTENRSRCRESIQEISAHKLVSKTLSEKVQYAISIIDETLSKCTGSQKEPAQRDKITSSQHNSSRSHRSYASNSSHGSRQSSYLRQRMKSEAAKCRLEFAEQEAKLQLEKSKIEEEECITAMKHARQKKNLEIDINLLAAKRDAMEAQTETENNTNELITKEENSFLEYNHPQEPELVDNTTKYSVENNIDVAMVTVSKSSEKQEVLETGEIDIAEVTLIDSSNISSALQVTTNPVLQQETNPQSFSCPVSNIETRHDAAIDYNNNANLNAATEFARLFMKNELYFLD